MSRILQLVTRDEPGGVRVLARMVERGLTARGHAVATLALGDGPLKAIRQILTGGYDAILSYQVAASLLGHAAGAAVGVPVRATHLTAIPSAMRPLWRWLDHLGGTLGLHTAIVANSLATKGAVACYAAAYRRRLRLIPHGVAPLPVGPRRDWRDELGIAPLAPLLMSSGRLVAQKNHTVAVAALADLPATHLVIAGQGALREALLRQAEALGVQDRLHLVGDLDPGQLASLMAEADIYVFPSTWESFGLAVVEAAMLGLPVVASNLPVLREVLWPALAHFHAADDAQALADTVTEVIAGYPLGDARQVSAAATRRAHGVDVMIDAYCRLLEGTS